MKNVHIKIVIMNQFIDYNTYPHKQWHATESGARGKKPSAVSLLVQLSIFYRLTLF